MIRRLVRVSLTSVALAAFSLSSAFANTADSGNEANRPVALRAFVSAGPPGETEAAPSATPMKADLVQRADGSWVIAKLQVVEGLTPHDDALEDHSEIEAVFDRYERAWLNGDFGGLSSVWIMNPAERDQVSEIVDSDKRVAVQVRSGTVEVEGDRASVFFLQERRTAVALPRTNKRSRRGMAAFDSAGNWDRR